MARLIVYSAVSLDGYFTGSNGDLSWGHSQDAEWQGFVEDNARGGGSAKNYPVVAERMNNLPKVVFSRTLAKAVWNNTTLLKEDLAGEVRKLKRESGPDMVIMGSGSIVSQLTPEGLIDEYQLVLYPVVLGRGRTLFDGVREKFALKLTKTRTFRNGNVLLCYEPLKV
jgi:dihydrofolate reductase